MPLPIKRENMSILRPNLQAKTGLVLDGKTGYVQLPSMTMDSIEIECLIDEEQTSTYHYILDARTGLTSGWISGYQNSPTNLSIGADWDSVEGYKKGEKTIIKAIAKQSFTDDIAIFSRVNAQEFSKGTLYKVTCYLNGELVAEYDFTKENEVVKPYVKGDVNWNVKLPKRVLQAKR